jgi:hypothetical protein
MTLKNVGIGVDGADDFVMIAVLGTHTLVVSFLFTRVHGLIACSWEVGADARETTEIASQQTYSF